MSLAGILQKGTAALDEHPPSSNHFWDFMTILPNSVFISIRRNLLKNSVMSGECCGRARRGQEVSWVLAQSPGEEVPVQVDISSLAFEFTEWFLRKLDQNPFEPSYTPACTSFYPNTQFTQLSYYLGPTLGVGVGLSEVAQMNQSHSCPPGPAVWSWVIQ